MGGVRARGESAGTPADNLLQCSMQPRCAVPHQVIITVAIHRPQGFTGAAAMSVTRRAEGFRLLCCLLLLGASSVAMARDVRLQGANGDGGGGCRASAADAGVEPDIPPPASKPVSAPARKANSAPSLRGNDSDTVRAPRWHSFLPGMFR